MSPRTRGCQQLAVTVCTPLQLRWAAWSPRAPPTSASPASPTAPGSKHLWRAAVSSYRVEHPNYNAQREEEGEEGRQLFASAVLCGNETMLANDGHADPFQVPACFRCASRHCSWLE